MLSTSDGTVFGLTADEAEELRERVERQDRETDAEECRASLALFVKRSWSELEPGVELEWNWHHQIVCNTIQSLFEDWHRAHRDGPRGGFRQRARNVIFNLPPGSLKSRIIAVCLHAWAWTRVPSWSLICSSANPDVALRDARLARDLIESRWYQTTFRPRWRMKQDRDAVSDYGNTSGGFRISKGAGAKFIGLRADWIVNDDPNDPVSVEAESNRSLVNERWEAIYNRVNDERKAVRVGVQQRTHEMDWTGYVMSKGNLWSPTNPGGWMLLVFPTEFDPKRRCDTIFGADPRTDEGQSIHDDRYPAEIVEAEKRRLGSYRYSGQHAQLPAPASGGLFPRSAWRFYRCGSGRPFGCSDAPAIDEQPYDQVVVSVDASFKGKGDNDRVGVIVVGQSRARRFVLDNLTGNMTFTGTLDAIRWTRKKYPGCRVIVEDAANGPAIIDTLSREIGGVVAVPTRGGKFARAASVQACVESGDVFLPEGAPWADSFVDELAKFPRGEHDDQVDALTHALSYLTGSVDASRIAMMAGL